MTFNGSRTLVIAGLVLMLAGAVDPLEGSVVILGGSALAAAGAFFGRSRRYRLQVTASVLIAIGAAALFGLSALGGAGGDNRQVDVVARDLRHVSRRVGDRARRRRSGVARGPVRASLIAPDGDVGVGYGRAV